MRREFKDDLVATGVLALCTVVLLLPARPGQGAAEVRLAAPGAPVVASPSQDAPADGAADRPVAGEAAGPAARPASGGAASPRRLARPHS